jgi:hypothetical protein
MRRCNGGRSMVEKGCENLLRPHKKEEIEMKRQ